MKDYGELKRLAEAATQGQWNAVDYGSFNGKSSHWYVETKSGENVAFDDSGDPAPNHWDERGEHDMKFIASANPAAVLALIAEVERLSFREKMLSEYGCEYCAGSGHVHRIDGDYLGVCDRCSAYEFNCAKHEIEKLKNENESLKKDAARFRFIEQDASSGISNIYGDEWVSVIDSIINEDNNK